MYLFFSKNAAKEPRLGPSWFGPEPFVGLDVVDWEPDAPLVITPETKGLLSFPKPLAELALEGYRVQAVARFNDWERDVGTGAGNAFSSPAVLPEKVVAEPLALDLTSLVPERTFKESEWSKLLEVPSPLLTGFHRREVALQGAVILPASYYAEPERRYPVIFTIPGFGGTHLMGERTEPIAEKNAEGVEFLRVILDPSCPLGHHVFADSANNGPVGQALIEELIPALDQKFRTVAAPRGRFLTGHSSGGWSSLWLQVTYPQQFAGTWSTAPDPVDFHDYQRVNLYAADQNIYRDAAGERRPIARRGEMPVLWYDDFARMEWTLGHGGQLHSFEAVFSPRGEDGRPRLLFDRETGAIDRETAETWKPYDIEHVLRTKWDTLGPQLKGKLHVYMGDLDTFYLEGATRRLKETLKELGSDAVVEMVPGKDHGNLLTPEFMQSLRAEMVQSYLQSVPKTP